MAITTLPYPNMDFVPLDILTATELDQIVANIEAMNTAGAPQATLTSLLGELNLSDVETKTLTFNGGRTCDVTLAQNPSGTLFKFSGHLYFDNSTGSNVNLNYASFDKVAIAGASGSYGFPTGLFLNSQPVSAKFYSDCGYGIFRTLRYNKTSTGYMDASNFYMVQFAVGTDGQIYISAHGNDWSQGNVVIEANTASRIFWLPITHTNGTLTA